MKRIALIGIGKMGLSHLAVRHEFLGQHESFKVFYFLTNDFQVIDFSINDGTIVEYKEKFNRNIFDDYSVEELYEIFSKLEYWNGEEFVLEPVMSNKDL